jgi:hypothetical protein
MRWRIPLVLTLGLLVVVSCDQQPTDPLEEPVAAAPEFNFMNGPASPGNAGMERFVEPYTFNYTIDWATRWLLVTYDVWEAYAGCTVTIPPPELLKPWDIQQKERETRDGVLTTLLMQREDVVYIMDHLIYDQSVYDPATEVCPWIMATWKYRGPAKFVVHREYLGGAFQSDIASATGLVEDRDGNQFRLNYKERYGTSSDMIRIQLTPIGK